MAKFLDQNGLSRVWSKIKTLLNGKVDKTRKVNGKALSSDITITSDDIEYIGDGGTLTEELDYLEGKVHEHSNKSVLDGITSTKVANWDALTNGIDSSSVDYRTNQTTVQEALDDLYSRVGNPSGGTLTSDDIQHVREDDSVTTVWNELTNLQYSVGEANQGVERLDNRKQDKLTAGTGISIVNNVISATGGGSSSGSGGSSWSAWSEIPLYYENSKWCSVDVLPPLWSADLQEVEIYFQIICPDVPSNFLWLSQTIKIPTLVYEDNVSGLYIYLGEICANTNNGEMLNPTVAIMGNVKAWIENGCIRAMDDQGGWCGDYCSLKCFCRSKVAE